MDRNNETSNSTLGEFKIPSQMKALVLDGVGFDHLRVKKVPTPTPGPDQLLARVDAAGVCTSLIKLVEQGPAHHLVYGWDIQRHPLILGDEGALTLVQIGANLHGRYRCGDRCVVQPAVDHPPINHRERYRDSARGIEKVAVGYTLPGHLAEYLLIPEEVIQAGCVLSIPGNNLPSAHAAMSEPLSCIISSQDHHLHLIQDDPLSPRRAFKGLREGGVTLIIGAGAMGRMHIDLAFNYRPRTLVAADLISSRLQLVEKYFRKRAERAGIGLYPVNPQTESLQDVIAAITDHRGADDVIVAAGSRSAIETAQYLVARHGNLNLFGGLKKGEDVIGLDTGIVHYRETVVTGSSGGSPWDVKRILELMTASQANPDFHISCVGDLEHAPRLLEMVKAQQLGGKAVIYPHRRTEEIRTVDKWTAEDEHYYLTNTEA